MASYLQKNTAPSEPESRVWRVMERKVAVINQGCCPSGTPGLVGWVAAARKVSSARFLQREEWRGGVRGATVFQERVLRKMIFFFFFFFKFYWFILDREERRKRETSMCGCLSCASHWGPDLACNPGMCPDREWNRWPSGLQAGAQSTEPHQPGRKMILKAAL